MRFITASSGQLLELGQGEHSSTELRFSTGIAGLDSLFGGSIARGAVHELLHPSKAAKPMLPAMFLAQSALGYMAPPPPAPSLCLTPDLSALPPLGNRASTNEIDRGVIVISDPKHLLYPPAAAQLGIPLSRLYLLHPANRQQELWAIGECLASAGVAAVVAELGSLTQVQARRLQLSAERGQSVGIFLRPASKASDIYAAATRTLVTPVKTASSARTQGWTLQLLHGHGCPVGMTLLLEYNREEHTLHTSAQLAHHASAPKAKVRRASA